MYARLVENWWHVKVCMKWNPPLTCWMFCTMQACFLGHLASLPLHRSRDHDVRHDVITKMAAMAGVARLYIVSQGTRLATRQLVTASWRHRLDCTHEMRQLVEFFWPILQPILVAGLQVKSIKTWPLTTAISSNGFQYTAGLSLARFWCLFVSKKMPNKDWLYSLCWSLTSFVAHMIV